MSNPNVPGVPATQPASGSNSNLQAMQPQSGAPALTPALLQQQAAMAAAATASTAGSTVLPGQQPMAYSSQQLQLQQQQQMQMYQLQLQAAAAAAAARAPSPAGAQQPGTQVFQLYLNLPTPQANGQIIMKTTVVPLPPEYVAAKRDLVNHNIGNIQAHPLIYRDYVNWDKQRKTAGAAAAPPAKRAKVEPQAPPATLRPGPAQLMAQQQQQQQLAAAMKGMQGGARPPLPPGSMPGMMMGMQAQMTPAQVAAASAARLQASLAQRRAQFAPIVRPTGEEEKQFVPKPRLQALVKQVGQGLSLANAKASDDAEQAVKAVAEDFISSAVSFAVSMARRRKAEEIEPADLLLHLERTWNIQVPGFSSGDIKPYQRKQASKEHQQRMVAVRKAMAAAAAAAAAASKGAQQGGAGAAQPAADDEGAGPSAAARVAGAPGKGAGKPAAEAAATAPAAKGRAAGGSKGRKATAGGKQQQQQGAAAGAEAAGVEEEADMPDP